VAEAKKTPKTACLILVSPGLPCASGISPNRGCLGRQQSPPVLDSSTPRNIRQRELRAATWNPPSGGRLGRGSGFLPSPGFSKNDNPLPRILCFRTISSARDLPVNGHCAQQERSLRSGYRHFRDWVQPPAPPSGRIKFVDACTSATAGIATAIFTARRCLRESPSDPS